MAVKKGFGKTWWGNAWVEAMERLDRDSNRLPRGRSYARNGSVRSIEIKEGQIFAKVQGSRLYNIRMSLKRFSDAEIGKTRELVASNPVVSAGLSLGNIPETLLPLLDKNKLHIFPSSWNDIDASCSCPDWANPCKHLAAVYYITANEIDKDPFLLFNLKGIKPGSLMESPGSEDVQETEAVGPEPDFFAPYSSVRIEQQEISSELPDLSFKRFDIESAFYILPENPLFYSDGDFRKALIQGYRSVKAGVETLEIVENPDEAFSRGEINLIQKKEGHLFFFSPPGSIPPSLSSEIKTINIPAVFEDKLKLKKVKGEAALSIDAIFDRFLSLPLLTNTDAFPAASFFSLLASAALAFVRSEAYLPEVAISDDGFQVRYVPLIHDEKTKEALDWLKKSMPANACIRESDKGVMTGEGVPQLLSLIMTHIIQRITRQEGWSGKDKLHSVFFQGKVYRAERFEERQTARAVSGWLERLSIRKSDISPVVRVEPLRGDSFSLDIEVENRKDPLSQLIPLSKLFDSKGKIFSLPAVKVRTDISKQVGIAGEHVPALLEILNSKGKEKAVIGPVEMGGFLSKGADVLGVLGIKTVIPKELKRLAMPTLAIRANTTGKGETVSYLSLDSLLDFSWEIAIGDTAVSKEEFRKLAKGAGGIVRFRDSYVLLNPDEAKKILERIGKPAPIPSSMDILRSALIGEMDDLPFNPDAAFKKILDDMANVPDIDIPPSLNAMLRPYQERGFRWLYSNTAKGFGSCMADDMGLGKTIQVITFILKLKEEGRLSAPVLVACPTTLVGNWRKECERFAPSLEVEVYHGTERKMSLKGKDLLITTYGILRRDLEKFRGKEWGLMVIDEAQNIKNPDTDQTKAVKGIKAGGYIAMSGTPVENRLTELWSIFDFINRGYLGQVGSFRKDYALPIEKYRDKGRIERLRRATAPFLLRRLKSDKSIISDLPDKLIFDEYCYLSKEQTAIYQQVVDKTLQKIERSDGIERKGLIFSLITSLKQICNHPAHYAKKGDPLKELSGKAEKTVELIGKLLASKEKALVFTQYREMGDLLVAMIKDELGEEVPFFHGGIARGKRDRMVEEFQTNDSVRLMIISLKAGGTGLNLTAASNVIHYDLWWNPAVEAQATDRAYRIGQEKNVMVHRLITLGTFEEKIDEMIKAKKELADLTVSTGEQWITELSNRELKEIFGLGK